jgi:LDH2 family malate/lactate/ureidoglycolate dehydrogenase
LPSREPPPGNLVRGRGLAQDGSDLLLRRDTLAPEQSIVVMPETLRTFVTEVFMTQGLPREEAAIVADHLVEADLRGVYSHGVIRVDPYIARLRAGGMNPTPNIKVVRETPGTAVVDGDNGAGQVVGVRAMEVAIAKAKLVCLL